ncbi:SxtJ family membrane protein [candidate division KSB1 bacterium]
MKKLSNFIFPQGFRISTRQSSDSGMALVLILLLVGYFTNNVIFYKISIPVLVMNMIFPRFYYPFAIFWLGLSNILGLFIPRILLSIVFFIIVLPVAIIRKLFGKDVLLLKNFKRNPESVFKTRNYGFGIKDIEKPY